MAKDVQERNHLVKWSILIGVAFFSLLTALIIFIDFDILWNPSFVKDVHIRAFLFIITGIVTIVFINKFIKYLAHYLNYIYLKRFDFIPELGVYKESQDRLYFSNFE